MIRGRAATWCLLLAAAAAALGAGLAACGSDTATTGEEDAGGSSVLPQTDSGGGTVTETDAGCKKVGPLSGSVAKSVPRDGVTGGLPWESPENGKVPDNTFAKVTLGVGQQSEMLKVTGFGFAIPAGVNVTGVEVEFKRQATDAGIVDGLIELTFDKGRTSGRPKYMFTSWPRAIVGTHHYGAPLDRWGNDVFAEDVNSPEFGVEIWAKREEDAGTDPLDGLIDSLRIYVHYCDQ